MEVTYLGHAAFLLKHKEVKLVCDPFEGEVGFKLPKVEANIVTISHDHFDHNAAGLISGEPRVINGPGEYEVKGVTILGVASWHDNKLGAEKGPNTIYSIRMDEVNLCHLGDLGHTLSDEQVSLLGEVDVLMVPTGGVFSLDPETAWKVVEQINPYIIIPMHFKTKDHSANFGKRSPVEDFVKVSGLEPKHLDKLVVKKAELNEEQLELVILNRYGR